MNELESLVHESAILLDTECEGWANHIDLYLLDMGTPSVCIYGFTQRA